jgi:chloramphenicol O-acetyltransferase type A
MSYRILDDYARRPHFEFYLRHPHPFYAVSFELDATLVRARAKELGASTFAAMVWTYHRALASLDAFRVRLVAGELRLYDALAVGMTVPAPGRTFTFATLAFDADPQAWLARARAVMTEASTHVDLGGGAEPDFAYYTALPRVPFTSFTHVALADPTAGQPEAAFGRFREAEGRSFVPVGVLVNHLYVDGADLGDLHEALASSFAAAF